jgi:hypothetical protein
VLRQAAAHELNYLVSATLPESFDGLLPKMIVLFGPSTGSQHLVSVTGFLFGTRHERDFFPGKL